MSTEGRVATGVLVVLALLAGSCGDDATTPPAGVAGAGQGGGGGSGGTTNPGTCDPDPLKTGLVAQQTGVSVDAFDCAILRAVAKYGEPDAMIFKAIIYAESRFDNLAAGCTNMPCGQPAGWTAAECGCLGLMQVVVACGGPMMSPALLPNGHPNMTTDKSSAAWAGSIFNPDVNVDIGISALADNRAQVVKSFPGCTVDQYTLMAIGNYASYGSTKGCTTYNTDYINLILPTYKEYATAAGYAAHAY
ncbi:MAG: lytic transglycosylase domain-containing protein [Deltaproteobacteria bacterium]|nr:lytic transglycosylase domain-containing protein [Deltaproteobacteria bacterium]